jgi:hypothetical protein
VVVVPDDPGLDPRELLHEVRQVDHEVTHHGEVPERLDRDRTRRVVAEERPAGQFGLAVHGHAAAAADAHPARPAERQGGVDLVLDVVQAVEDRPLLPERDVVLLPVRLGVGVGPVPGHPEPDAVRHRYLP